MPTKEARGGAGRLGRGKMGRAMKNRAKPNRKYMRKTTKKGAYKPARKKQMVRRRAPIVETKKKVSHGISTVIMNPRTGAGTDVNPYNRDVINPFLTVEPFLEMFQGLDEDQMVGRSIFAKYLKLKGRVIMPVGNQSITYPLNIKVVHGWLKIPFNRNSETTPVDHAVVLTDLEAYIKKGMESGHAYLGEGRLQDKLEFRDKTPLVYTASTQSLRMPNRDNQLNALQSIRLNQNGTTQIVGSNSDINFSCKWTPMRKIHYEKGAVVTGKGNYYYPNHSWLPYVFVYTPVEQHNALSRSQNASAQRSNPGEAPAPYFIPGDVTIKYNACMWYTDG